MAIESVETLSCLELEQILDPFLDGEICESDRDEATAHIASCQRCNAIVSQRRAEHTALISCIRNASQVRAPAHLREKLEASISSPVRKPFWEWLFRPLTAGMAAACVAGALMVFWINPANGALVEEAVNRHHLELPMEASAAALPDWFKGKLPFRAVPPRFAADGMTVVGGRISNIREWPAAYIRYKSPQGDAGLFIIDDPGGRFDTPGRDVNVGEQVVRVANRSGYNVAIWREDGIVYSLVSELGEEDLVKLVRAAHTESKR